MAHTLLSGPHTLAPTSVSRTMLAVMLALLPATLWGLYLFGWPALYLFVITLLAALACEVLCLALAGKPLHLNLLDGSALLTGWLLAMSLPPWAPWWIGVLGSLIAIGVGKQVFGGIGYNLFNPAMVARVALLVSFPLPMTLWTAPAPLGSAGAPDWLEGLAITFGGATVDAFSGASLLGSVKTEFTLGRELAEILPQGVNTQQLLLGSHHGSLGETSALLVALGGIALIARGVIRWTVPFAMLGTVALLALLFNLIDAGRYPGVDYHLLSGGLMLAALFIATDPVTSPNTTAGQLLFGAGCGALVYLIRTWGGYPEGVAFAVLLMNALVPLIDHYLKPRIYGRDRGGRPLPVVRETAP
ncbi:RnfABCDGE type electron transport complex subunit D [Aestuariirhabdus litorea]|uniref:Ion-translocating oxidoreductase complex subunit D n=1 Tax=Aestuariirhabdus litorea TaxID=2528527 RepID=A0A3P3VJH7_9GAMM|nr:RnfABCDGE type electron transport complex subunit D [Aestuariirhabdus litorea]RRJ82911.1 RnfABCDGE type electron transport complex subunit D [Aestuariirhabdus litorea]RWW93070.1 RnfABCDGE type electron transport complex subunit D [Endozoicomonadaceae bacterium GTF-13]